MIQATQEVEPVFSFFLNLENDDILFVRTYARNVFRRSQLERVVRVTLCVQAWLLQKIIQTEFMLQKNRQQAK